METNKCVGNCPNVCKAHMGEFTFCTNSGCVCHKEKCSYGEHSWHKKPDFEERICVKCKLEEPVKEDGVNQTNDWREDNKVRAIYLLNYIYDNHAHSDNLAEIITQLNEVREEAVRETEEKAKKIVEIELGWVRTQKGNHAQAGVERMLEKILSALGEIKG